MNHYHQSQSPLLSPNFHPKSLPIYQSAEEGELYHGKWALEDKILTTGFKVW